jgi:hypothetical protein
MERNRTEITAGIIVLVLLIAVLVYSLLNHQSIGAFPILIGVALRELLKSLRRGTPDSSSHHPR